MFFGGPGQYAANLIQQVLTDATRFHDVRLLAEILGDQLASAIQCATAILVQRADYQLRAVDRFNTTACFLSSNAEVFHCFAVVSRRHEIVQQHAVRYLARELHHLHSGSADVDRDILW